MLYAVKPLVGGPDVQRPASLFVGACLQVVEVGERYLLRQFTPTTVPCGPNLRVLLHPACQSVNLGWVLVASHQTDACDSDMVLQHRSQSLGGQGDAHVGPEVLAVAAQAVNGAAADADGQGYLVGYLGKDLFNIDVFHMAIGAKKMGVDKRLAATQTPISLLILNYKPLL